MTRWECTLWSALKESFPATHWRKQVPFGPYTADFATHAEKLVIELDGSQHGTDATIASDTVRTRFLESEGYRVVRFWNNDVTTNLDGVLTAIADHLSSPLPLVGRGRGGGQRRLPLKENHAPNNTDDSCDAPTRAVPAFRPPHKGEETKGQLPAGVR